MKKWIEKIQALYKNFLTFLRQVNESSKKHETVVSSKDEDLVTDSKAALSNEISPASNKIIIAIAAFFIIGIIWAYFGVIDQTISASGVVIPSSHVKIIQSLDGGILEKVFVKEGQIVEKDQMLVELDDTRYKAEYQQLYEQYLVLLASIARLTSETQDKETITFPKDVQEKEELIETQQKLFDARKKALKDELEVLQKSYKLANQEVEMYQSLIPKGVVSQLELLRSQRSANELQTKIFEKVGNFRKDALAELNKFQGDLSVVKERLLGLRDKMIRTKIASPVRGIIKKINIVTIGAVVQPAVNIMEIVPLEDTLLVQARVSSADIGFVYLGAPATVKIDAYDYSIYGDITGKVEYISADIIEDPTDKTSVRHVNQPASYYLVNIRTPKDFLVHHGKELPIIPGMTTTVQIRVGQRTVMEYILKPLIKAKSEALRER